MNQKKGFIKFSPLFLTFVGLVGSLVGTLMMYGKHQPPAGIIISPVLIPFIIGAILPLLTLVFLGSDAADKPRKATGIAALVFAAVQVLISIAYIITILTKGHIYFLSYIPGAPFIVQLYSLFITRFAFFRVLLLLANASYIAASLLCFSLLCRRAPSAQSQATPQGTYNYTPHSPQGSVPVRGGRNIGGMGFMFIVLSFVIEGIYIAVGTGGDIEEALDFLGSPLSTAMLIISSVLFIMGVSMIIRGKGSAIQARMRSLGTLKGRTFEQILRVAGAPNSISATTDASGNKITIRQWIAPSYHIALLFDENDICLGVSSETSV